MTLNLFAKQLSRVARVGRWVTTAVLCVSAIAFIWQGAFSSNMAALASPGSNLIATRDAGDQVQHKANKDAGSAKGFIEDTKNKVEQTARNNAAKVDNATDNGSFLERKAKKDASRIQKRAEEDADLTQKAVDNTKNAVERTVDTIKDAFN
ncbi:hypothetical protein AB3R30_08875 [Leptolyngbyaceae cyanobacterium UHCC 1019]